MTFNDLYRDNVILSRRDRSRRALFWARITGLALMLCVGAILRSEPQLRQDLMVAGMDVIAGATGRHAKPAARTAPAVGPTDTAPILAAAPAAPEAVKRPRDRVKVNRHGVGAGEVDAQGLADQVGKTLAARPVGG